MKNSKITLLLILSLCLLCAADICMSQVSSSYAPDYHFKVNNTDFFPIGWYYACSRDELNTIHDCGGTVVLNAWYEVCTFFGNGQQTHTQYITSLPSYLQYLNSLGLKAVIDIGTSGEGVSDFTIDQMKQVANTVKNDPAVFAYYLFDEPYAALLEHVSWPTQPYLQTIANAVRLIDGTHPLLPVINNPGFFQDYHLPTEPPPFYTTSYDAIGWDCYPFNTDHDATRYTIPRGCSDFNNVARLASRRGVAQTKSLSKMGFILVGQGTDACSVCGTTRQMTENDVKYETISPIIQGARGILYWAWNQGTTSSRSKVNSMISFIRNKNIDKVVMSDAILDNQVTLANFKKDGQTFSPNDYDWANYTTCYPENNHFRMFNYIARKYQDSYYLLVANDFSSTIQTDFVLDNLIGTNESVCLIEELNVNGTTTQKNPCNFTDTFYGYDTKIYKISVSVSGPITSNTTWCRTVYVTGNVTVNAGVTLTVNPGVVVKFNPSTSLTVNGVLNANGTPTNKITFTSASYNWGSIIVDHQSGGSASTFDNVIVENASTGIQLKEDMHVQNSTIRNSIIRNCTASLYIYGGGGPIIENNTLEVPGGYTSGITCQGTYYPAIGNNIIRKINTMSQGTALTVRYEGALICAYKNDISGSNYGMYSYSGSSISCTDWGDHSFNPNNKIHDCNNGMSANDGYIDMFGYNCIYNNTYYDLSARNYSNIYNIGNYFGGGNPKQYKDATSTIVAEGVRSTCGGSSSIASESNGANSQQILFKQQSAEQSDKGINEFAAGKEYERQKDYTNAINHFKEMVKTGIMAQRALSELVYISSKVENSDITTYLESLKNEKTDYQAHIMQLLSGIYRRQGEREKCLAMYDEIMNKFPNTRDERDAWFQKFYFTLHVDHDTMKASGLLDKITAKYSEEDEEGEIAFAQLILGSTTIGSGGKDKKETTTTSEVPTECTLESYPNPFNPMTVLSYQLSAVSNVKLCIFDMLGREIAVLQDEMKEAGKYSATFNASKLASGIYFSRLTVKPNEGKPIVLTKKMMLMK